MSTEEEQRLYQCLKKYQTIIKQFDELVESMDVRTRPPLRRKSGRGSNSSCNEAATTSTGIQPRDDENNGGALVHTITRFLHELKSNPTSSTDPNRSST
ncbi:hypothetical protein ERO13_A11G324420v2 [Gossypium hirsutum]|uniref:Uncharacterized protein n=3 Tax=Gossypium TaxID=3633 RepID=A0A2P5W9I5_GOSBA|nr:hypothetical protein ES319_A11G355800v1 [Gossypium barbadense]KAG4177709.1 hypothetical protein ERO13_A11G324420v2 [Gossypium hirsutum]PPR87740.1 hypothetical protein GOBAR_AA32954 [Gossypium barbadense]TYG96900.1 hypothetical protein ES288_A11G389900v1 [Gossypium darwinii]TYJ12633.1 hypothetical protein E1A91_A11G365500v1 [Gossypium mustelinum]